MIHTMWSRTACLATCAALWSAQISTAAALIQERQYTGAGTGNPFNLIPTASPIFQSDAGAATTVTETILASASNTASFFIVDGPSSEASPFLSPEETPSPSLTETVILIPPSGTVGGSIIITSVPIEPTFTFFPPGPVLGTTAITGSMRFPMSSDAIAAFPSASDVSQSDPNQISTNTEPMQTRTRTRTRTHTRDQESQMMSSQFITSSDPVITSSTTPTTSPSTTLSSSPSSTSSSSSSSPISSSSTSSTSLVASTPTTAPQTSRPENKAKVLSGGAIAGIAISLLAFAGLFGLIAFLCLRRRLGKRAPSVHVYPEEAYLYDPPITPPGTSFGPHAGPDNAHGGMAQMPPNQGYNAVTAYGPVTYGSSVAVVAAGAGAGVGVGVGAATSRAAAAAAAPGGAYIRPVTPDPPGTEQDGLLSGRSSSAYSVNSSGGGAAAAAAAGGLGPQRGSRGRYSLAPVGEVDLGDRSEGNPFADPPTEPYRGMTAYDAGSYAVGQRSSIQSRPGRRGQPVSPPMQAVREAWDWEE